MSAIEIAKHTLSQLAIVLLIGVVCSIIAKRLRVPDIVLYLLAGMALGPSAGGLIHIPADGTLNQLLLTFGASYLLFDGGASLRFKVLKEVWITIVIISTLGVLITGAITTSVAVVVGLPVMTAMLQHSAKLREQAPAPAAAPAPAQPVVAFAPAPAASQVYVVSPPTPTYIYPSYSSYSYSYPDYGYGYYSSYPRFYGSSVFYSRPSLSYGHSYGGYSHRPGGGNPGH